MKRGQPSEVLNIPETKTQFFLPVTWDLLQTEFSVEFSRRRPAQATVWLDLEEAWTAHDLAEARRIFNFTTETK